MLLDFCCNSPINLLARHFAPALLIRDIDLCMDLMRHCVPLNNSFFNTLSMVSQYAMNAYFE